MNLVEFPFFSIIIDLPKIKSFGNFPDLYHSSMILNNSDLVSTLKFFNIFASILSSIPLAYMSVNVISENQGRFFESGLTSSSCSK